MMTNRHMLRLLPIPLLAIAVYAADDVQREPEYVFGTTIVSTSGFQGRIYHLKNGASTLPRFKPKKSVGTIYTNKLNVWPQRFDEGFPGISDRVEWFAIDYSAHFWVEHGGQYRFSLMSDDGSRLSIDGVELIENDGTHNPLGFSASAWLSRGVHRIRVSYFQGPRYIVALVLAIAPPGEPWRIFDCGEFLPPKNEADWIRGKVTDVRHSDLSRR